VFEEEHGMGGLGFLLTHGAFVHHRAVVIRDVFHFEGQQVRGPQQSINRGIKKCEVSQMSFRVQ
jgi:hypothetical protein